MSSEYRVNKSTGQVIKDDGTGWKPVASVRNKTTGEILIDEGNGWQPMPGANLKSDRGMTLASERANQALASGQRIAQDDLTKLGQLDFSSAALARLPAPTQSTADLDAFDAQRRAEKEALRVPDSDFKERSIIALNVPTFGSGPRFAAGMQTLGALAATPFVEGDIIDREGISGAADQFLDDARIHQRRGRTERPGESIATEVIPSLFQGKTIIDTLGKRLIPQANAAANVARTAAVGGGYGALYGASQNESGTAEGVAGDAAFGGALGIGGGVVLKGLEAPARVTYRGAKEAGASIYDALADMLGKAGGARDKVADEVAIAAVRRSMERSGLTIDQIMDLVKRYEGKPAVLAEVLGQDAINALTALTRRPGSTPQKAQDLIEDRFYGRPDRMKADVEDATGIPIGQLDETLTTQLEARQEAAKPIYDALYKRFNTIKSFGESLKRINRIARTPAMQKHLKLAEEAVKTQAALRQVPISKMSKMEYWDLVKRSLDDEINSAVAKGEARTKVGASVADLTQLKKAITDEFDRLTDGAYAAAREAGGEAPRLRAAATAGQKALQARNPREVAKTVAATLAQDLPALRAGMVDDLGTRIDKGMTPGRVRVPDVAGKLRAGLGDEAGGRLINRFDAEAALSETGARWAPRMNSVTGTVMESGATQMGDDLINAGMNLATGNKVGLVRQAINFMRTRGFSQRQIDAIGDLLLSSPEEGLRRLKLMTPDGVPGNALAPVAGGPTDTLPPSGGAPSTPNALAPTASPTPAGPIRAAGFAGFGPKVGKAADDGTWQGARPTGFQDDLARGSKPFNDERLNPRQNKIFELYTNGYSFDEIAEEVGASSRNSVTSTISQLQKQFPDLPRIPGQRNKPPVETQRLVDMIDKGLTDNQIVERTGKKIASIKAFRSNYNKVRAAQGLPRLSGKSIAGFGPGALRGDLGNALTGAGLGGIAPADSNEERLRNMAIGAGVGGASRTVGRLAGAKGDDVARTAGVGGPKTPAQAVKFETPGSPEWEAAKAKGLDMSQAGRMARAKEMGFNTDKVYYHGTTADFDQFSRVMSEKSSPRDGMLGIHLGTSRQANDATSLVPLNKKKSTGREFPPDAQILPVYVAAKNPIRLEDKGGWSPANLAMQLVKRGIIVKPYGGANGAYHMQDVRDAIKEAGFDSIVYKNTYEGVGEDSLIVLDENNIRSVNAAFDPDKAASPILTAGAGGGRKPPTGKPSKLGTRTADAAAIAALGIAPPAQADAGGASAELEAAKQRVTQIETQAIPQLQADLRLLEDPNADPKKLQELLQRRGDYKGAIDGKVGPLTRQAIADNVGRVRKEIETQRNELNLARKAVTQQEMRAAQAAAQPSTANDIFGKAAPWIGAAAGVYLGYRTRGGAVKKSQIVAAQAAQKANAMLNANPVTRGVNTPNSVNTRAANLNEFWRQGGAGESVPFRANQSGKWSARPKAAEPSQLFPAPPRYNSKDAAIIGTGVTEAGIAHVGVRDQNEKIKQAKADVQRYAEAGDVAGMQRALKQQKDAETMRDLFILAERAGLALSGARLTAGLSKPYAKVAPDVAAAERERALILQALKK